MQLVALLAFAILGIWLWESHPTVIVVIGLGIAALFAIFFWQEAERKKMLASLSPEERQAFLLREHLIRLIKLYGPINPALLCPHCGFNGCVRSQSVVRQSTSVSGTFAKIETVHSANVTQRFCDNCSTQWDI